MLGYDQNCLFYFLVSTSGVNHMISAIGIDIGGTNTRLGLVSPEGKIMAGKKVAVGSRRNPEEVIAVLDALVRQLLRKAGMRRVVAVGVGVPGIVEAKKGIVYSSPHYPQWKNFSLSRRLGRKLSMPVTMDNDANMASLGEAWKGAASGWKTFLMITLGTGIGGALVIDSSVFHGTRGFAGEVGHMVIEAGGPPCACGSHGCFEAMVSATALQRMANESAELKGPLLMDADPSDTGRNLAGLVKKGNQEAKRIFDVFGYYLGIGLASLVNVTGIEKIVLGGGLSGAGDFFIPQAVGEMKKRTYAKTFDGTEIRIAQLGDSAGILGGASLAFRKFS